MKLVSKGAIDWPAEVRERILDVFKNNSVNLEKKFQIQAYTLSLDKYSESMLFHVSFYFSTGCREYKKITKPQQYQNFDPIITVN
jgi:hypothetical protein